MDKIIIDNKTSMSMVKAFSYIKRVMDGGRISRTSKGDQYCFIANFGDGVVVYCDKNKKSDKFTIIESREGA